MNASGTKSGLKLPGTEYHLHSLLRNRWSPRSFSSEAIGEEQVMELLSAAQWAPSANNEQPWLYGFALKNTSEFETLWQCLLPGNQPWAGNAAVLMLSMARTTFSSSGKRNPWAMHDVGMANAQLILQATHRNIYGHLMAGFDSEKLREYLNIPAEVEPVCLIALGYLGEAEQLSQPYQEREKAPRKRLALNEIIRPL